MRLFSVVLIVLLLASGKPQPITPGVPYIQTARFLPYGYVIEQQSIPDGSGGWINPVVNPLPGQRVWDIDDLANVGATGSIEAGQSVTVVIPFFADDTSHLNVVTASGFRSGRLTFAVPELAFSYSLPITRDGQRFCIYGPSVNPLVLPLPEVPNSNGGHAIVATYSLTITSDVRDRSVGVSTEIAYPNLQVLETYCGGTTFTSLPSPEGVGFVLVGP